MSRGVILPLVLVQSEVSPTANRSGTLDDLERYYALLGGGNQSPLRSSHPFLALREGLFRQPLGRNPGEIIFKETDSPTVPFHLDNQHVHPGGGQRLTGVACNKNIFGTAFIEPEFDAMTHSFCDLLLSNFEGL